MGSQYVQNGHATLTTFWSTHWSDAGPGKDFFFFFSSLSLLEFSQKPLRWFQIDGGKEFDMLVSLGGHARPLPWGQQSGLAHKLRAQPIPAVGSGRNYFP